MRKSYLADAKGLLSIPRYRFFTAPTRLGGAGIVGICGTPGTGKKTVAPKVSELLGLQAQSHQLASSQGIVGGRPDAAAAEGVASRPSLARRPYGHLLPYLLRKPRPGSSPCYAATPRPSRKTGRRRYPSSKVTENVEAELIGVLLYDCVKEYGDDLVREYDTTAATPEAVANAIARDAEDSQARERQGGRGAARLDRLDPQLRLFDQVEVPPRGEQRPTRLDLNQDRLLEPG